MCGIYEFRIEQNFISHQEYCIHYTSGFSCRSLCEVHELCECVVEDELNINFVHSKIKHNIR